MSRQHERYVVMTPRSPRKKAEVEYASHSAGREVSLVQFIFERGKNIAMNSEKPANNFTLKPFVTADLSSIHSREYISSVSCCSTCSSSSCGYLSDCSTCPSTASEDIGHLFPNVLQKSREEISCKLLNAFESLTVRPILVSNALDEFKVKYSDQHDCILACSTKYRAESMVDATCQWLHSSAYRSCVYSSASSQRLSNNSSSTLATSSSSSRSVIQSGKRKRVARNPDDSDNENTLNKPQRSGKAKSPSHRPFACHFWKRDPEMHHECLKYQDFYTFHRLKNHFARKHKMPKHCHFCYQEFTREEDLKAHVRARQCEKQPERSWEGFITEDQEKLMKPRLHKTSEEEKWFAIWDILFPGIPRPEDPYIDFALCKKKAELKDVAHEHAPQIVTEVLQHYESRFTNMGAIEMMTWLKATFGAGRVHDFLTAVWLDALELCSSKMMDESAQSNERGKDREPFPESSAAELDATNYSLSSNSVNTGQSPDWARFVTLQDLLKN